MKRSDVTFTREDIDAFDAQMNAGGFPEVKPLRRPRRIPLSESIANCDLIQLAKDNQPPLLWWEEDWGVPNV